MKKILYIITLFILFAGCRKEGQPAAYTLCESDQCLQYQSMWKNMFMQRNSISEAYFNAHIVPFHTYIDAYNDAIVFHVRYKLTIDWMTVYLNDQFAIHITSDSYPALDVPRYTYLDETGIMAVLDHHAFSSEICKVNQLEHLYFPAKNLALIEVASHTSAELTFREYRYENYNAVIAPSGQPFMHFFGTLSEAENKCVEVRLNLATGACEVHEDVCSVN